jgi:ParB family chromosome partitioning protein
MGHARALLALEQADAIRKAAQRAIREGLSVRATEALVRQAVAGPKKPAPKEGVESAGTRDLVARLQRRLGARCRIVQKSSSAGRLEIDYTSLEELDGILAKIGL